MKKNVLHDFSSFSTKTPNKKYGSQKKKFLLELKSLKNYLNFSKRIEVVFDTEDAW